MSGEYRQLLDYSVGASMVVEYVTERQEVVDYAVVLLVIDGARTRTVRVYDGAHGVNEMHRYSRRSGKQLAEVFHRGTLGEGMRSAIGDIKGGYHEMIQGWWR